MQDQIAVGIIGGSGLYNMPGLQDVHTVSITTPYGSPSGKIVTGILEGRKVAFLPRHGVGHVFTPSTVPYRANICALKMLGVRFIIAVNACGSLREDYAPGHIVIPDQLYDQTRAERGRSFFETGVVAHISVADPFCPELSALVADAAADAGGTVHRGGTFVTVEGPRFSTRGESHIFRQLGCSIIGMTTCPEAFLAREAEISYTSMSHITDYDVWHTSEAPVTVEMVMETMHRNLHIAQEAIRIAVARLDITAVWQSHRALDNAVMTDPRQMPAEAVERLRPIAGRLFSR
ncbi:S-methyl-5'-thioadenosine phosphorylase [Kamptonema cortianum]|nr:S-methyl-5'-thioadenosine phosphorylase [Kamptonema cortianum]